MSVSQLQGDIPHKNHTVRVGIGARALQTSGFDPTGEQAVSLRDKDKKRGSIPYTPVPVFACELFPLLHDSRKTWSVLATFDDDNIFAGFPDRFRGFEMGPFRQERVHKTIRGCRVSPNFSRQWNLGE